MKHLFKTTIAILVIAFSIASCNKESSDPIIPDPDPETGEHPELWSYDIGFGNLDDIYPAVDESDNIYFSIFDITTAKVVAIGLDKNGVII